MPTDSTHIEARKLIAPYFPLARILPSL